MHGWEKSIVTIPGCELHRVSPELHLHLLVRALPHPGVRRDVHLRAPGLHRDGDGDHGASADQVLLHLQVETRGRSQR